MSKSSWNTSKLPFPSLGSRRFRCARVHSISHRFQSLLNCLYFVPTDARAHKGVRIERHAVYLRPTAERAVVAATGND